MARQVNPAKNPANPFMIATSPGGPRRHPEPG